jgi:hypothetical protein
MCPSLWKAVVDAWADTPILPVDPRYRTVFYVDESGAHVSLSMEACAGHLGREAFSRKIKFLNLPLFCIREALESKNFPGNPLMTGTCQE